MDLTVVFRCKDGEHRCSELVLQLVSDYFDHQLAGRKRMGNDLVFTYEYSTNCIKSIIDLMHGLDLDKVDSSSLLEMIKFLNFEGKGKPSEISTNVEQETFF